MWAFIWLEMKQKIDSLQLASYSFLLEWEEDELQAIHSLPASCLPFLRQEINGLQDYIFITGFLFVFWDLHLNIKASKRNFLGGPVVKNPPSNVGDVGSIPGQGTKIPHAVEPQWKTLHDAEKIPYATTKTHLSQRDKYISFRKQQ